MTDSKILDKIRKLHMKAESCKEIGSDIEAQTFAQAVNRLLNEHRLEMTDIQFEESRKAEPVEEAWIDFQDVKVRRQRIHWIEVLSGMIARAHSCDILVSMNSSNIKLVGSKTNRAVAEYLIVTLTRTAEKIADKEYVKYFYECRENGAVTQARGFRAAFLMGFVTRIGARFAEEKARMSQNSTALVRFDQSKKDVSDFMAKKNTKHARSLAKPLINQTGYRKGVDKANSMDIQGRGIEDANRKSLK